MKKGDIIKFQRLENTYKARVNWVNDGNVGLTLVGPDFNGSQATVLPIGDCTMVTEFKGDANKKGIKGFTDEELIASIERLKGMRFPRKMATRVRKSSGGKKTELTKTMEALEKMGVKNDEDINAIIQRALKGGDNT